MPYRDEPEAINDWAMCECGHTFLLHCRNKNPAYRICAYHDAVGTYCPCGRFRLGKERKPLGLPARRARSNPKKKTKLRAAR